MIPGATTAIKRTSPPSPLKWLVERGLVQGDALDYGCGRRTWFDMEGWDPHWHDAPKMKDEYQTIYCGYVLNVVDPQTELTIIEDITSLLAPGGIAYVAVRRDLPVEGRKGRGVHQRYVTLDWPLLYQNSTFAIYHYTKGEA